jgi:hypothetical protein
MRLLLIIIFSAFQAGANQASDLSKVRRCFDRSQKMSAKLNHRFPATAESIKIYRKKNNYCIRLSIRYENRYEHLRILDEIEEEMNSAR